MTTSPTGTLLSHDTKWLFGRTTDLCAFGGAAVLSLALVAIGAALGWLDQPTPTWVWVLCVLGLDVAHVWATLFRVYLDKASFDERRVLYSATPIVAWMCGALVHYQSAALFWRLLAYFAVFHFVRQQAGWLRLYQRRMPPTDFDRHLERATVYMATLFPLFWWHTRVPRGFTWFMEGDFVEVLATPTTQALADACEPLYWAVLATFLARQFWRARNGHPAQLGKIQLVVTTWLCWWLGIIALDSDYAFTVTNVVIHAVPYFVLTFRYATLSRSLQGKHPRARLIAVVLFLLPLLALAFVEEGLWDRWIWMEHSELFGSGHEATMSVKNWLVPLLALPQLTHYILDGLIWRGTTQNARFLSMIRPGRQASPDPRMS